MNERSETMKISIEKLELAKARACMDSNDIIRAGIPKGTYRTIGRLRKEKRNNE